MRSVNVLKLSYRYVSFPIFLTMDIPLYTRVCIEKEDMRKSLWHDIFDFNACKDPCRYVTV